MFAAAFQDVRYSDALEAVNAQISRCDQESCASSINSNRVNFLMNRAAVYMGGVCAIDFGCGPLPAQFRIPKQPGACKCTVFTVNECI